MKYGVIDITSTSISLRIYEVGEEMKSVFSSRSAFSAQSFTEDGVLGEHGVQKMVRVLKRMQEECSKYGVKSIYAISSSVVRNLKNAAEVAEEIKTLTGITINVLNAETEAYCDYISNKSYYGDGCVLIDVSGASVTLCDMAKEHSTGGLCLDFGALTVQKKFVSGVFPTEDECEAIKKYLKKQFKKCVPEEKKSTVVLTGNISRSLCAIYADVYSLPDDNTRLEYKKLKKLLKKLVESDERAYIVMKTAPEKIYFITVALIIVLQLIKRFTPDEVIVSDMGVKEGYLSLCLNGGINGEVSPVTKERKSVKIDSVEELAEHIKRRSKGRPASVKGAAPAAKGKKRGRPPKEDKEVKPKRPVERPKGGKSAKKEAEVNGNGAADGAKEE